MARAGASGLDRSFEQRYWHAGARRVCGVDEAGRGPLAGPVVAAACVVPPHVLFEGVDDSKQLDEPARERLFALITQHPEIDWCVVEVSHEEVDRVNILQATMRGMERAVAGLKVRPDVILIDGPHVPQALRGEGGEAVVKGDSQVFSIACAAIIAKVTRDRTMCELDKRFPGYGLAQHKGYPTAAHCAALARLGATPVHRKTFAPVTKVLPAHEREEVNRMRAAMLEAAGKPPRKNDAGRMGAKPSSKAAAAAAVKRVAAAAAKRGATAISLAKQKSSPERAAPDAGACARSGRKQRVARAASTVLPEPGLTSKHKPAARASRKVRAAAAPSPALQTRKRSAGDDKAEGVVQVARRAAKRVKSSKA